MERLQHQTRATDLKSVGGGRLVSLRFESRAFDVAPRQTTADPCGADSVASVKLDVMRVCGACNLDPQIGQFRRELLLTHQRGIAVVRRSAIGPVYPVLDEGGSVRPKRQA